MIMVMIMVKMQVIGTIMDVIMIIKAITGLVCISFTMSRVNSKDNVDSVSLTTKKKRNQQELFFSKQNFENKILCSLTKCHYSHTTKGVK